MDCLFLVFIPRTGMDPQVGRFQPVGHTFGTPAAISQVNMSFLYICMRVCTPQVRPAYRLLTNNLRTTFFFFQGNYVAIVKTRTWKKLFMDVLF